MSSQSLNDHDQMQSDPVSQQPQQNQQQQQTMVYKVMDEQMLITQLNEILNNMINSNEYIKMAKDWMLDNYERCDMVLDHIVKRVKDMTNPFIATMIIYLINDVLHFSLMKRVERSPEQIYIEKFANVLPIILSNTYYKLDQQQKNKIVSIIDLWVDRNIYSVEQVGHFKKCLSNTPSVIHPGLIVSHIRLLYQVPNGIVNMKPFKSDDINYNQIIEYSNPMSISNSLSEFYSTA